MSLREPNPVLTSAFEPENSSRGSFRVRNLPASPEDKPMTMEGTVNKTAFLLTVLGIGALVPFYGPAPLANFLLSIYIPLALVTIVVALFVARRPHNARQFATAYAVIEGLLLGTLSRVFDTYYPGIAPQALLLTVAVAGAMLFLYRAKIIAVTRNFRIAVISATIGVFVVYLISLIGSFFGFTVPYLHDNTPIGILISVAIVALAAANLALDFDFVERGVQEKYPASYEWVGAFGLVVTLAWLYVEILRLLSKLRSRN